ncbi:MAG: hypothetical protein KIS63_14410, partial [Caldilineales bacterium]|nr:hypothetical protein [Caldilineales bacterium]
IQYSVVGCEDGMDDDLSLTNRRRRSTAESRLSLREEIVEGCQVMADLYLEIEQEYHRLEEEAQKYVDIPLPCL